jgi:hypothetical protein
MPVRYGSDGLSSFGFYVDAALKIGHGKLFIPMTAEK